MRGVRRRVRVVAPQVRRCAGRRPGFRRRSIATYARRGIPVVTDPDQDFFVFLGSDAPGVNQLETDVFQQLLIQAEFASQESMGNTLLAFEQPRDYCQKLRKVYIPCLQG